jgi:serine/threonine-protein kinase
MTDRVESAIAVGAVLRERYEVRRLVGEGGMGAVFEAFDTLLEKRVAVKVLRSEHAGNAQLVARFELEAKIASAFQHPNVATTFDVGAHDGARYLVMEFLDGVSLADAMARSVPLSDSAAVAIVEPIARALARAHAAGVIHRDVKPENIFLCRGERDDECIPKLVDFGIARREQSADFKLTATATIIGTPAYMPPEQARGASDITASVDQYALAVVLYELLSGAHPHAAPSTAALLARKLTEPPVELRAVAPQVGAALAAAVMRALSSEPSQRFADIGALRDALAAAVGSVAAPRFPADNGGAPRGEVDSDAHTELATPEPAARATAATGVDETIANGEPLPVAASSRARSVRAPFVAASVGLVLASVFAISAMSRRQSPAPPRAIVVAAPLPAAPAEVTLQVRVEPAVATITVDGRALGSGEASATVRAGATVELVFSAPGYVTRAETRVLVANERIERMLERAPVAAPSLPDASLPRAASAPSQPRRGQHPLQLGRTGFVLDTEIHRR